jgi:hypothetical protein
VTYELVARGRNPSSDRASLFGVQALVRPVIRPRWAQKHRPLERAPEKAVGINFLLLMLCSLLFWVGILFAAPFACGACNAAYDRGYDVANGEDRPRRSRRGPPPLRR